MAARGYEISLRVLKNISNEKLQVTARENTAS